MGDGARRCCVAICGGAKLGAADDFKKMGEGEEDWDFGGYLGKKEEIWGSVRERKGNQYLIILLFIFNDI